MTKQMKVFAFDFSGPAHLSAGLWRHENDGSADYKSVRRWVEYAQLLERAGFDGVFFADNNGYHDKYHGSAGSLYWLLGQIQRLVMFNNPSRSP